MFNQYSNVIIVFVQITVTFTNPLSISITSTHITALCSLHPEGLAGCITNGSYVSRGGDNYRLNSSEQDMFNFADSCKYLLVKVFQLIPLTVVSNTTGETTIFVNKCGLVTISHLNSYLKKRLTASSVFICVQII